MDIPQQLMKLGLSEKQAQLYILLTQHKALRIQEIVSLTTIARSSVYGQLRALQEKGLIERVIGDNFVRVKAYPLDSLRHHLEQQIVELQEQTKGLGDLETALSQMPGTQSDDTVVRYYKGRAGARQLFWNSLKTSNMVYVMSSFGRSQFVGKKFYMGFVSESYRLGITEKVITNPTERALGLIKRDAGTPLARTDGANVRVLDEAQIHIHGDTLMYDNIYAHIYFDAEEINGFEIESRHFAQTQRAIFETLWTNARPLQALGKAS
jgi:sugar-specific transcriptional regulator TrmB